MKSDFLRLNAKDFLKGLLVAIIMTFIASLNAVLQDGTFDFTWLIMKPVVMSSVGAGLAYLIKNFFTNSEGKIGTE